MNIKRGLFRLWLVLSLLFGAYMAFVSWDVLAKEFRDARRLDAKPAATVSLYPIACWNKRGAAQVDYLTENGDGPSQPWQNCWYTLEKIRTFYPEYNEFTNPFDLLDKTYLDTDLKLFKPRPWDRVVSVATFALGAPLVILIIGAALVWAVSGFSRPRTP
jgi:hypothetical protein